MEAIPALSKNGVERDGVALITYTKLPPAMV